MLTGDMMVHNR